mgnify:CR=1 FL=1
MGEGKICQNSGRNRGRIRESGFDGFPAQIGFILVKGKVLEGVVQEFEKKICSIDLLTKENATFEINARIERPMTLLIACPP